jgi:hypothetical protein
MWMIISFIHCLNVTLQFRAAAKNMRSALIDRMRKAAPSVFQLPPDVFKPGYQRDTVPELVRLLKFSNDHSKKDHLSKLPPILFPPVVRRKGRVGYETKLFQAQEIFLVSEQVNGLENLLLMAVIVFKGCFIWTIFIGYDGSKARGPFDIWQAMGCYIIGEATLLRNSSVCAIGMSMTTFFNSTLTECHLILDSVCHI